LAFSRILMHAARVELPAHRRSCDGVPLLSYRKGPTMGRIDQWFARVACRRDED